MNRGAVISRNETKTWCSRTRIFTESILLDPTTTFSVSRYQTAAGSADIMSHLIENYFSKTEGTDVQDGVAEGLLKAVIKICPSH